ncbi:hypothetical protein [Geobacillus subterraneus]|uniref:Uncharacterized protein n=1 Tax=Geobacillus subterraneus TaxID=129338 RepID=A0A679FRM7_9BACL|nr:hypothetical protein [Geobacillus subterraneus]BBW98790.1 hypothetical protein GsuE55_36230 [Geobacillus subterraneus]
MPMDLFRENAELTQDFHPRVEGKPLPMDLFRENAELTQDFHPRVEGKPLPMDLFRENAKLTRDFHPRVEGKSRCPWNFSLKTKYIILHSFLVPHYEYNNVSQI